MRVLSLALVLCGFWWVSSGHTEALLLGFMVVACAIVVLLSRRLGVLDQEGHPTHLVPRALGFWGWLIGQVAKSSWRVVRIILMPSLPIAPSVQRVPLTQPHDLGRAIVANCITLTPGTVTLEVAADHLVVHCLTARGAASLHEGETNRRVAAVVGAGD